MSATAPRSSALRTIRPGLLPLAALATLGLFQGCSSGSGSAGGKRSAAVTVTAAVPSNARQRSTVTFQGQNLQDVRGLTIGTAPALTWTATDTTLTAEVPPDAQSGPTFFVGPDGTTYTGPGITILPTPALPAPVIARFDPAAGPVGTQVTLTGTALEQISSVTFNGTGPGTAQAVTVLWQAGGNQQLVVQVPPNAQTGTLTIATAGGTFTTQARFVVTADAADEGVPQIAGVFPDSGGPGERVTITSALDPANPLLFGAGFGLVTQVNFGNVGSTSFLPPQDGQITVRVPELPAGPAPITLVGPNGISTAVPFTVTAPLTGPGVDSFELVPGAPVPTLAVTGTGLSRTLQVFIGGVDAPDFTIIDDTNLLVVLPPAAQSGTIVVRTPEELVPSATFFLVPDPAPAPPHLPVVTAFATNDPANPSGAAPYHVVQLTGRGFTGARAVAFSGIIAERFTVLSDTEITATVPPEGAVSTGPVSVATNVGLGDSSGPAGAGDFQVLAPQAPPSITAFSPAAAEPGETVTITGLNLGDVTQVDFNGMAAPAETIVHTGDTQLTVEVPYGAPEGAGPIVVVGPGGMGSSAPGTFTVTAPALPPALPAPAPAPQFTGFSPEQGLPESEVVLAGSHLASADILDVSIAGTQVIFIVAADGTSITAHVPGNATPNAIAGPVVIDFRNGTSLSSVDFPAPTPFLFSILPAPAPTIEDVSTDEAIPGEEIGLHGTGFATLTEVAYGDTVLTPDRYDLVNDTFMRVRIPDSAQADAAIQVTNEHGSDRTNVITLIPSRRETLGQALASLASAAGTLLEFPQDGQRSPMNAEYHIPVAPVFHPQDLNDLPGPRLEAPSFTLHLKLPAAFNPLLPGALLAELAESELDPDQVEIHCVSQDYAWDGVSDPGGLYLLRPHYWTHQDAETQGIYSQSSQVLVGLVGADAFGLALHLPQVPNPDQPDFGLGVIDVRSASAEEDSPITPIDNQFPLVGLNLDAPESLGFWSLVDLNGRAAATLHLFFNDADQAVLQAIADGNPGTPSLLLANLAAAVQAGEFTDGGSTAIGQLLALFRPAAQGSQRIPDAGGTTDRVLLNGTCLTGATGVSLTDENGTTDIPVFQVLSDTLIQFSVPAGNPGNVVVTTPYGASDPIVLP